MSFSFDSTYLKKSINNEAMEPNPKRAKIDDAEEQDLSLLPEHCILHVFSFLNGWDIMNTMRTCKRLHAIGKMSIKKEVRLIKIEPGISPIKIAELFGIFGQHVQVIKIWGKTLGRELYREGDRLIRIMKKTIGENLKELSLYEIQRMNKLDDLLVLNPNIIKLEIVACSTHHYS